MKKEHNHWLSERSKLFAKYAESMPRKAATFELVLDKVDLGWIDMHFKVNDVETLVINASSVCEPFEDIRDWLEQMVTHLYTPSEVRINDETFDYYLCYEPLRFMSGESKSLHPNHSHSGYGLFYVYDDSVEQIVSDALFDTRKFIRSFYTAIIEYGKQWQQDPDFIEHWVWDAYNSEMHDYDEDSPELREFFLKKVRSEVVENYLGINE